jgi:PhnB protein
VKKILGQNISWPLSARLSLLRPMGETQPWRRHMTQDFDEMAIGALLEARAQAIRTKDPGAALSHYAPDLVRYDLAPPLARTGAAALDRDTLIAWFDTWRGPIRYELKDVSITASGDIAFVHGFVRIGGTKTDGYTGDVWARQTVCLRKRGDAWKIVHEHISTPFYMDGSVKAAVDLTP